VPAAGEARRLPSALHPKELLGVGDTRDATGRRPKAVSEYLFDALSVAGVAHVCVIVAAEKQQVAEFFGGGERHGVSITYVCQSAPTGMADAVDAAYRWIRNADVVVGMPDTVFRPLDAVLELRRLFEREGADLALGVFPTDEPNRLGPVLLESTGRVVEVFDKPPVCTVRNTWGIACWGPRFTELLHDDLADRPRGGVSAERPLGAVFQMAVERGFNVQALSFAAGMYIDVGTLDGLIAARSAVGRWPIEMEPR
jgi:glucose-1-phosphate thymidylyltransferase